MRIPLKSERDAFRLAIGVALTAVAAIVLGVLAGAVYGAILAGVVVVSAAIAALRAGHGEHVPVLARAARTRSHPAAKAHKEQVLVVANVALEGDELDRQIASTGHDAVQVDVLAPVLPSASHYVTSDVDDARAEARRRLERSLRWARRHELDARGRLGDDNAIASIAGELRLFGADRVIVVTHPAPDESRQESQELERLHAELDVPVSHVVVGARGG